MSSRPMTSSPEKGKIGAPSLYPTSRSAAMGVRLMTRVSTERHTPPSLEPKTSGPRPVRAPRGPERTCKGWVQEAALRMLMNNLDPEVAEDPDRLVVYGGSGRAA